MVSELRAERDRTPRICVNVCFHSFMNKGAAMKLVSRVMVASLHSR
jgi:hypothetical protein